jgi:hypothetical protein
MVMVGVLLDPEPDAIGEWLADAAAFDAAGADALWVECAAESQWDMATLAAALAVVTFRTRLLVALPDGEPDDRTAHTLTRLSGGRFTPLGGNADWERIPAPQGREDWRRACADAEERGVPGIVVPAGPRLLDILRNPEDPGERYDLQLAQG